MSRKINHLEIVLNKPAASRVYVPGEIITGFVNLCCTEKIRIKCIRLVLFGKTSVQWEDFIALGRGRIRHLFNDKEILIQKEIKLPFDSNSASSSDVEQFLEEGEYSLPFQIALDEDLPTSLEHAHARVRYLLRAIVDIPWDSDVSAMLSFTVISLYDLNTVKKWLKNLYETTDVIRVGCFPFCSHKMKIRVLINKCVFVPGERINFTIEISNPSSADIADIRVSLTQVIKVSADALRNYGRSRFDKTFKKKMGFVAFPKGSVAPKSEEKWIGTYRVPATCPTYTDSRILKIEYLFRLFLNVSSSLLSEDELSIPVIIGTIPMLESVPQSFVSSFSNVSPANLSDRSRSMSVISFPNENFYSLEASVGGDKDDLPPPYTLDDTRENEQDMQSDLDTYRPYYIYYKDFSIMQ